MKKRADNRTRLLRAAEISTYRHGFDATALADIAKEARMPLGNLYYYYKTKNAIGNAVIDLRFSRFGRLLKELERSKSPAERLCGFVDVKIRNRDQLARSGCPVGTLCSEMHKQRGPLAKKSTALLAEALRWMEVQFRLLGRGDESAGLAVHLLSATQGVSVLAHSFHNPHIIDTEAVRLKEWIRSFEGTEEK